MVYTIDTLSHAQKSHFNESWLLMRRSSISVFVIAVLILFPLAQSPIFGFDTGHHWEITSQTLRELGFSDDARHTTCVSNWLLDYYSSSPTASKKTRELLSKLHCDNLRDGAAIEEYMAQFTRNARKAMQAQDDPREALLLMGAILHVVQDLYSHSTWAETHVSPGVVTNYTLNMAGGAVPYEVVSGAYEEPDYVAGKLSDHHPEHGSYESGINKDSHQRPNWDQANYLAYCASYEFVCVIGSWVSPTMWRDMKCLQLGTIARKQLDREVSAAYGISIWVALKGQHGHWKGGESGDNLLFFKSVLQFMLSSSSNSRWYRAKTGFAPLAEGLYEPESTCHCPRICVPGLNIDRNVVSLKFTCIQTCSDGLDALPLQKAPDLYAVGAVYYGRVCRCNAPQAKSEIIPDAEPKPAINGEINVLFRDRVLQNKDHACNPWAVLAMVDPEKLWANDGYLSFYIEVGDEDCGADDSADVNKAHYPDGTNLEGILISYHVPSGMVTNLDTGEVLSHGEGFSVAGDDPDKAIRVSMQICNVPVQGATPIMSISDQ